MILVLASGADDAAAAFATELGQWTATSVLTCRDLAVGRCNIRHPDFASSTFELGERTISVGELRGVLNLLPAVLPDELVFYPEQEREYQASELLALLTFLVSSLVCPVVNRPTPSSLTGPYASPISWLELARRLGIPLSPLDIDSDLADPFTVPRSARIIDVSYFGEVVGASGTKADEYLVALARHAHVGYLRAVFSCDDVEGPRFVSAHAVPDVRDPATRAALISRFRTSG